jgi:hypothetical protein
MDSENLSAAELRKRRLKEKSEERMAKILNSYGAESGAPRLETVDRLGRN